MRYSRVASRYASALLKTALHDSVLDAVRKDVDLLQMSIAASRELANFLKSPIISAEKKAGALKNIYTGKVSPLMLNFLLLLVEKNRERELPQILRSFNEQYNEHRGIVEVQVRSAIELEDAQKQAILGKVRAYTGKTVEPHYSIDPALIGGFQVQIGDRVLDGSVRHQLDNLKKALDSGVRNN